MKTFATRQLFSPLAISLLYTNAAASIIRLNDSVIALTRMVSGFSNIPPITKGSLKKERGMGLQKQQSYPRNKVANAKDNILSTIVKMANQQGLSGVAHVNNLSFNAGGTNAVRETQRAERQQADVTNNGLKSINDTASVTLKNNVLFASQKTTVIDDLMKKVEPTLLNVVTNAATYASISNAVNKSQQMAHSPINTNLDGTVSLPIFHKASLPILLSSLLQERPKNYTAPYRIYQQDKSSLVSANERFASRGDNRVIANHGRPNKEHNSQPWFIAREEKEATKYQAAPKEMAANKHVLCNTEPQRSTKTININKSLIEHFTINVSNAKDGITDFKRKVEEVLLEILNSVNTH